MPLPRRRASRESAPPPPDERTIVQVLLGAVLGGVVGGGIFALVGGDAAGTIGFGITVALVFLWIDLQARRKRREDAGPP